MATKSKNDSLHKAKDAKKEIEKAWELLDNGNALILAAPRHGRSLSFVKKMIKKAKENGWSIVNVNSEGTENELELHEKPRLPVEGLRAVLIDNALERYKTPEEITVKAYPFLMEASHTIKKQSILLVDNMGLLFNRLSKQEQDDYCQTHYLKKLSFEEFQELLVNLSWNNDVMERDCLRNEITKNVSNQKGNDVKAYYNSGNAYVHKGDYDKAIECYEKIIELNPDDGKAYNNMGFAYRYKGNYDKAIACYEKTIELMPDDATAYGNMGIVYRDKGNFDKAIEYYEKSIALKPDNEMVYGNMGIAYDDKGNFDKAIECYEKVIELKPDNAMAYYYMGCAYDDKGNYDKTIECYEKAIELNPDDAAAYYNMGCVYDDKDNYDKAIECYEKAIELNPDDAAAYNNIGIMYRKNTGNYDKAIECYEKAITLGSAEKRFLFVKSRKVYIFAKN